MADQEKLIVEHGMEIDQSIVDDIKIDQEDDGFVEFLPAPDNQNPNEVALESKVAETEAAPEDKSAESDAPNEQQTEPTDNNEQQNNPFEFTVNGETKEYTAHQIKSALGRQSKMNEILGSDEYKMGLLMQAAKSGDKKAQKQLQEQLVQFTGSEDADGMVDKLQDETAEFDAEAKAQEKAKQAEFDALFSDVKDSVDYEANFAKIDTDLRPHVPEKIFTQFFADPADRRALYDLAASGNAPQVISAFNLFVGGLSPEKQLEVKTDRSAFVQALELSVKQIANATAANGSDGQGETEESSDLDAVSTKPSSRVANPTSSGPDWDKMSDEDFQAYQIKMGLSPT
jgi:hypothetical protein